MEMMIWR